MHEKPESEQQGGSVSGEVIWRGREVFFESILRMERLYLARLGNKERFEKWETTEFFAGAREEWLGAWERFALSHGQRPVLHYFGALQHFHADKEFWRVELEPMKEIVLLLLRRLDDLHEHEETLRNLAEVIYGAARQGDVAFFKKISLALRRRGGRMEKKAESLFLAYYILCHWFAGLLWLMSEKPGWAALCAYTGRKDITKDAYRKACHRLGLCGYKDRMRTPPVLEYDRVSGLYRYAAAWTRMEPHLST